MAVAALTSVCFWSATLMRRAAPAHVARQGLRVLLMLGDRTDMRAGEADFRDLSERRYLAMADYERMRTGNIQAFLDLRNQVAAEAAASGLTLGRIDDLLAEDEA